MSSTIYIYALQPELILTILFCQYWNHYHSRKISGSIEKRTTKQSVEFCVIYHVRITHFSLTRVSYWSYGTLKCSSKKCLGVIHIVNVWMNGFGSGPCCVPFTTGVSDTLLYVDCQRPTWPSRPRYTYGTSFDDKLSNLNMHCIYYSCLLRFWRIKPMIITIMLFKFLDIRLYLDINEPLL